MAQYAGYVRPGGSLTLPSAMGAQSATLTKPLSANFSCKLFIESMIYILIGAADVPVMPYGSVPAAGNFKCLLHPTGDPDY